MSCNYKLRRNPDEAVALEAFEEVVNRLDADEKSRILMACRRGFTRKRRLFIIQNQLESELSAIEGVIKRFDSLGDTKLQRCVDVALISKAELQINEGNMQDAHFACDEIIQWSSEINRHEKTELAWIAFRGRTKALLIQGELPAAVDS